MRPQSVLLRRNVFAELRSDVSPYLLPTLPLVLHPWRRRPTHGTRVETLSNFHRFRITSSENHRFPEIRVVRQRTLMRISKKRNNLLKTIECYNCPCGGPTGNCNIRWCLGGKERIGAQNNRMLQLSARRPRGQL